MTIEVCLYYNYFRLKCDFKLMDCQACLYTNEKRIGKVLSTYFLHVLDINYADFNRIQPFISHKLHELVIRLSTNSRFSLDSVN